MAKDAGDQSIVDHNDFYGKLLDEPAHCYARSVIDKVKIQMAARGVTPTRGGVLLLFVQDAMDKVMGWMNEVINLENEHLPLSQHRPKVKKFEMMEMIVSFSDWV